MLYTNFFCNFSVSAIGKPYQHIPCFNNILCHFLMQIWYVLTCFLGPHLSHIKRAALIYLSSIVIKPSFSNNFEIHFLPHESNPYPEKPFQIVTNGNFLSYLEFIKIHIMKSFWIWNLFEFYSKYWKVISFQKSFIDIK